MERIPADSWHQHPGHVERYRYAAQHTRDGESVNDVACGSGYGSLSFLHASYRGYDKAGVPGSGFPGTFFSIDLDDPLWLPIPGDVTVCFETLEHVRDPACLAAGIAGTTRRAIFVSVPVVPTKHMNPYHLHDFTIDDIPPLFPGFSVAQDWAQPEEMSHVWMLLRDKS